MSSSKGLAGLPSVEAKLQKPTKQSAFEKQKSEAEAKRQREAAETAAVYESFVKSFDHDDDDDDRSSSAAASAPHRQRPGLGKPPSAPLASRRHFGVSSGLKSGPGSLGSPAPFGKKRSFQDFSRGPRDKTLLGFEDRDRDREGGSVSVPRAFDASDDEEMGDAVDRAQEKAIARPTLRLSNLPPGTSPAMIKALLPSNLAVEKVKIQPPAGPGGSERKCTVAIVTLSQETPANDMDAAVSQLQNRYMGYGFYLSLHRHLSSAVTNSALLSLTSSSSASHPFGAKPVEQATRKGSNDHARHGFHRGFAPPPSYAHGPGGVNRANLLHVPVKPPQDIRTLQLINKVIEGVLEHGPEFEALLMSRPEVQREEKWAWLWDARSEGGVWYRWMLWGVVTGSHAGLKKGRFVPVFEGSHAWKTPEKRLPFEYTTNLDEFVSDSDYNSSDDEDIDGDGNRDIQGAEEEKTFLNPLEKAKFAHLLARLPIAISKARKGDIARATVFAITHVSRGADEVVDMILSNVEKPLSLTGANPDMRSQGKESQQGGGTEEASASEAPDASAASLVGLYVVSDILSSSSTSGVRHAWRYRQLFETALRERKIFEHLGLMAERLGWGRLRAEKWKRSVGLVLNLWEGWCVFPAESQALFASTFENPPTPKAQDKADNESMKKGGKWKVVEANAAAGDDAASRDGAEKRNNRRELDDDIEGEPIGGDDVAGEPLEEDDVAGEPLEEDDVAGEAIDDDDVEGEYIDKEDVTGEPMDEDDIQGSLAPSSAGEAEDRDTANWQEDAGRQPGLSSAGRGQPKKRMRAADMFAD